MGFFHPDNDVEACDAVLRYGKHDVICVRRKGHAGDHESTWGGAARADKECFFCRAPISGRPEDSWRCDECQKRMKNNQYPWTDTREDSTDDD